MLNRIDYKIAIDGPAASGKSTTARLVARRLGYLYIDTGAMYRALTHCVLRDKIDVHSGDRVLTLARNLDIQLINREEGLGTLVNGEDISAEIRRPQVDEIISIVSAYRGVREIMVQKQRMIAASGGIVMDGRDIGTVVLPDAEIKIFMKASLEERARRRYKELQNRGSRVSLNAVRKDIRHRDKLDSSRAIAPLKPAPDAHIIDTSRLTVEDQVEKVLEIVEQRRAGKSEYSKKTGKLL
jgi:cytidylate kinase